ncbi:MAG: YcxB family protein [Lachnospiraceae bacterium]|nr:YcxB family protein [Lachnospiraceae bacterium]
MIELDITLSVADLYDFNLKHAYSRPTSLIASALGAVGIVYGITKPYLLLAIVGAMLLFYLPLNLYISCARRFTLGEAFKAPLHYLLNDDGITVRQGDQENFASWSEVTKAASSGRSLFLYTGAGNASILPRSQMGDRTTAVIALISEHVDPKKVKIRF